VGDRVRPARNPEPRPEERPSPPPDARRIDQETRQREVARIREMLQKGIGDVREDLDAQRFTAARERLARLQETAVPYRAELIDEVAGLRALEQEVTSQQISAKTAEAVQKQNEEGWRRRLQEIRGLLQDKRYPEAKTLANKLAGDSGVPEEVASQARDLSSQADQELKSIFTKTKVSTKDEVVKKPPR
jgi:DNA-directed RNA polymerase subunit F